MRLCDVGGLKAVLAANDGLGSDPVWSRTGSQLTGTDIQLFYARSGLKGKRQEAVDLVDQAQAAVIRALFCGELEKGAFAALVLHEQPPEPFMADEFVDGLIKLQPSRRAACIYLLENRMVGNEVTDLTWMGLDLRGKSQLSLDVITAAKVTRHIKLPYVFWEWATENIASPLLNLQTTLELAFSCSLPELQARYDRMVMIDRRADSASLLDLARQLGR